ncbi:hypothetical protein BKA70DRAFT_1423394 [Coprinopsis sp. MPI-PUGE-AT-0042]|nr:hypothetical protein BKA70DRAFT_1423394 [Coprinopsis sp. MPI-PUGE-AT-0042]
MFDTNYRSIREIIWSCLSVVFACTWTAVHPNVYGYQSTYWQRTRRRTLLFLLALLMPEVNLVWSVKQWLGAREITRRMNSIMEDADDEESQWTDIHSHFLQMGGYVFKFEDGHGYIDMSNLFHPRAGRYIKGLKSALLQRRDRVDELMDRSKTNLLSRTVAFGQMLWFCANFIGRYVEGLAITKLEVASLAYVVMTLATYLFWMNKPLDVDCPIVVSGTRESFGPGLLAVSYSHHRDFSSFASIPYGDPDASITTGQAILKNMYVAVYNSLMAMFFLFIMLPPSEWRLMDVRRLDRYPLLAYGKGGIKEDSILAQSLCAFAYAAFGGIHSIAWDFAPYSKWVQGLWRASSLTLAIIPPLFPFFAWIQSFDWVRDRPAEVAGIFIVIPACIIFIPARLALLVLPFLELTHLPVDAFKTVSWDDFFAHIS